MSPDEEVQLAMSNLEKRLTCRICDKLMVNPHFRQCLHSFCKSCLLKLKDACPVCKVVYFETHIQKHDQIATLVEKFVELKRLLSEVEFESGVPEDPGDQATGRKVGVDVVMPSSGQANSSHRATPTPENSFFSPANFNKRNKKGETKLQIAAIKGREDEVRHLLELGADVNTKDNANWTPLHEASHHGHLGIVEALLRGGANVNLPGHGNLTPLLDAVLQNRPEVVKILMRYGANPSQRNLAGQTALDEAQTEEMKELLLATVPQDINRIKVNVSNENRIVVLATNLGSIHKEELTSFAKLLNAKIIYQYSDTVTHFVTNTSNGSCRRTMKYLMSVLNGKWIVSTEWIKKCIDEMRRVPEEEYEVKGTTQTPYSLGPSKGRKNATIMRNPRLFSGCHFFFHGNFPDPFPPKTDLINLVKAGDGIILTREPRLSSGSLTQTVPFHVPITHSLAYCSHYIIYNKTDRPEIAYNSKHLKSLESDWLLESIARFEFVEPE